VHTEQDGAHAVFLAAEAGERGAAGVIDHAATQIGIAVGNVVSLLDPEMVVLVGGIGLGQAPRLLPAIRDVVRRIAPPVAREQVAIVAGELGDDAVLIGAAWAAQELLGLR
jgi:glucokinase